MVETTSTTKAVSRSCSEEAPALFGGAELELHHGPSVSTRKRSVRLRVSSARRESRFRGSGQRLRVPPPPAPDHPPIGPVHCDDEVSCPQASCPEASCPGASCAADFCVAAAATRLFKSFVLTCEGKSDDARVRGLRPKERCASRFFGKVNPKTDIF